MRSPWSGRRSVHPRAGFLRRRRRCQRRCRRRCRRRCQRWCRLRCRLQGWFVVHAADPHRKACRSRLHARFVVHAADTCRQACRCSAPRSSPCRTDLRGRSKMRGWRGSMYRCPRPTLRLFSHGVLRCSFFRTGQRGGHCHRLALGRCAATLACRLLLIDVVLSACMGRREAGCVGVGGMQVGWHAALRCVLSDGGRRRGEGEWRGRGEGKGVACQSCVSRSTISVARARRWRISFRSFSFMGRVERVEGHGAKTEISCVLKRYHYPASY